ncbi:MAG: cytochrome c [Planctomycetota bacterium]
MRTFHQGWLAYLGLLSYFSATPIATECIAETDSPTFNQDVAAIVHSKCSSCHRPGQAGPFSLLSYKDVARRAQTIEAVIDTGYMPPWKPVNHEIAFSNDRRLTLEEKELLRLWIANGLPRGSGQPPLPPKFSDGWQLGPPDKVIQMQGEFEVPASGPDIYRSFVFPLQLPDDKWVKAVEYRPTATSAVHHAIFFLDQQGNARRMDGSDGKAGIAGMSFLGGTSNLEDIPSVNAGRWLQGANKLRSTPENEPFSQALNQGLGGYVPGSTPNRLPGDLAMHLPAGSDIVMQTHFHPSGKTEEEQGRIAMSLPAGRCIAKSPGSRLGVEPGT